MRWSATVVLAVVGCVATVSLMLLDRVSGGSDLRTGLVPSAWALLAASAGLAALSARKRRIGAPPRWASVLSLVTALSSFGVAGFFFSLSGLSVLGSDLLDDDGAFVTSVSTFVASLLTFGVLPAGLLTWGIAVFRDHRVRMTVRLDPLLLLVVLIAGAALVSALPDQRELWPQFAWLAAMAALVTHFAVGASSAPSAGPTSAA